MAADNIVQGLNEIRATIKTAIEELDIHMGRCSAPDDDNLCAAYDLLESLESELFNALN